MCIRKQEASKKMEYKKEINLQLRLETREARVRSTDLRLIAKINIKKLFN